MINNPINVSMIRGLKIPVGDLVDARKIPGGPLYSRDTIAQIAGNQRLQFWSNGAIEDQRKWMLTVDYVCWLVQEALCHGRFIGSEWCEAKPGGPWAACDAFVVTVSEWIEAAHKDQRTTYYLKIAISCTGQMLLSASNHPEGT